MYKKSEKCKELKSDRPQLAVCCPHWVSDFWYTSVPRWRGPSCDWRAGASQNLLHPQISTRLSPHGWKATSPTIRHLSKNHRPRSNSSSNNALAMHFLPQSFPIALKALHIFSLLNDTAERFLLKTRHCMHSYRMR